MQLAASLSSLQNNFAIATPWSKFNPALLAIKVVDSCPNCQMMMRPRNSELHADYL